MSSLDKASALTPLHSNGEANLAVGRRILADHRQRMAGQYGSMLEALAGTGVDARAFAQDIGVENVLVNDMDPACVAILAQTFPHVTSLDINKEGQQLFIPVDLVYLDYNTHTLGRVYNRDRRLCTTDRLAFSTARKFVILNDSSIFGYRIWSKKHYSRMLGAEIPSEEAFYKAMAGYYHGLYPEWNLTAVGYCFTTKNGGFAYLLFSRQPGELTIREYKQ